MAGCGTQMQSEELRRGIESLESHAATGRLLAHDAALGRTRTPFARVEARELTERADHEAEKLADSTGHDREREEAVRIAEEISDAAGALQVEPDDRQRAAESERALSALATRAKNLAGSLGP
jgi:hypothetical protein